MTKSSGTDEISIAPEEWDGMLRKACAREPWADRAAPQRFAAGITFRWPKAEARKRTAYDRANDAIGTLRRVLPDIIADCERSIVALENPPPEFQRCAVARVRSQTERELSELRKLAMALPKLPWELSKTHTRPWQLDAVRLCSLYMQHVDPKAGVSADGPLVRFVRLALVCMGWFVPTTDEKLVRSEYERIAKALQRVRSARPQRDKCGRA